MELLQSAITFVLFLVVLGSLVIIHELGHFVTARLFGVRVLEFGIGFPPRARILRSGGETLYTLNWLPIGGFVKLEGEDGDDTDDPRSFVNASLPKRLAILLAGVAMNLVGALLIFSLIAMLASPLIALSIPTVDTGSPAAAAGLKSGEAITSVDGNSYDFFGGYTGQRDVIEDLRSHVGETVTLGILGTDGTHRDVSVTLRSAPEVAAGQGPLGIRASTEDPFKTRYYGAYTGHDPITAVRIGASETMRWFGLVLDGLRQVASGFIASPGTAPPVQGPVGIAFSLGDIFWNAGPILTLYVAGVLSANLALVNALPFPPLDGGRMLVIVLKRFLGSRLSLRTERLTYALGFAFLMAFLLWVTYYDVVGGGLR